jgi:phosphoribosylformylglycinamidine synthase
LGFEGNNVPATSATKNMEIYKSYSRALNKGLISAAIGVNRGGIAVALAKMSMAGMLGMDIDLSLVPGKTNFAAETLFSESTGRILLTIDPKNKSQFEKLMTGISFDSLRVRFKLRRGGGFCI